MNQYNRREYPLLPILITLLRRAQVKQRLKNYATKPSAIFVYVLVEKKNNIVHYAKRQNLKNLILINFVVATNVWLFSMKISNVRPCWFFKSAVPFIRASTLDVNSFLYHDGKISLGRIQNQNVFVGFQESLRSFIFLDVLNNLAHFYISYCLSPILKIRTLPLSIYRIPFYGSL